MSETEYTEPCGMLPGLSIRECGQPATEGWPAEVGGLVAICPACITFLGFPRKHLQPLAPSTPKLHP